MKAKSFVLLMCAAFIAAICLLAGVLAFSDRKILQKHSDNGEIFDGSALLIREDKTNYVYRTPAVHNKYILGGSKAGGLPAKTIDSIAGGNCYNFFVTSGCFRDFELYANYLLNINPNGTKEIILHLSSHEVYRFSLKDVEELKSSDHIPYRMQKNFIGKCVSYLTFFRHKYLDINTFIIISGIKHGNIAGLTLEDGSRRCLTAWEEFQKNQEAFIESQVLPYWEPYENALNDFFYTTPKIPFCNQNIASLKRIKKMCDEHGAKLTVIIGPTFLGELYKYASIEYAQYLKDIVSVCPAWNFSGINDVNLNPYNFYNGGHYWNFVGDVMLKKVYSKEAANTTDMDAFGVLLTPENIDRYVESQKAKQQVLKAEYDSTGTIQLQTMSDKSYLGGRSFF